MEMEKEETMEMEKEETMEKEKEETMEKEKEETMEKEKEEKGEEREEAGEVVYNLGPRRIERRYLYGNSIIDVVFVQYPIYPYRNKVSTFIRLDKNYNILEMFERRESWGGSKIVEHGMIRLTEEEFNKIHRKLMDVKDPDDFEELADIFERMLEERKEKFDRIVDKVLSRFAELYMFDHALTFAENAETLRKLKKTVIKCVKEWLA